MGGKPVVWELDTAGNMVVEKVLSIEGAGQMAKIRKDTAGFVMASTAWGEIGNEMVYVCVLAKLSSSLDVEWSKTYSMAGGNSQVFDLLVDRDGNYLLGGHTTVGTGVVNWDYLDIKVDSTTSTTTGWMSDIWVSYLVVLDTNGNKLFEGVYGDKRGNNAGEWLSVDQATGEVMIFTDSDTHGGFGFLKLTPN